MAKKKKKQKQKFKKQLKYELLGFLLIMIAIFGSGASLISDGLIPRSLEYIMRFFFGIWYFSISIFLFITGIYLLVKRKMPNFFHKRLIGFYIAFLGIILLTHIQTFERLLLTELNANYSIIKTTWNNYFAYIRGVGVSSQIGSGIVGAILFAVSSYLFSVAGTKMIALSLIIIGVIILLELSLSELFIRFYKVFMEKTQKLFKKYVRKKQEKEQMKNIEINNINEKNIQEDEEVEKDDQVETSKTMPIIEYEKQTEAEDEDLSFIEEHSSRDKEQIVNESIEENELHNGENKDYELPPLHLLNRAKGSKQQKEHSQIQQIAKTLEETFQSFGVQAHVTKVHVGPAVTRYEIYPERGVKVSRIVNLHDDLALALAAKDIRIEAPIPGKSAIGIEVPNEEVAMVSLSEVLEAKSENKGPLLFALGRDISGNAIADHLNAMPHLLIAGATGSGKSVCINGIITSILMRTKPHEVKMMMIDPKKVELNVYNGVPHLLTPVVTDPKKAAQSLQKVVSEMERRYELFSKTGTRNIEGYNNLVDQKNNEENETYNRLPYIVVIVDELADLMMVASSEVEDAIARLAQMARAAGIHLIIATQRPSVDVITGVIKANIPSRIAFSVSSQTDSRTILDVGGAEKLLGKGDMLYMPVGDSKPTRVQGAFLTDEEVQRVVQHCIDQQIAIYEESMMPTETSQIQNDVDDELFDEAVQLIIDAQSASVSMLQRRLRIGYNRAARLIDAMEELGIVGPHEGSRPRTVLVDELPEQLKQN